MALSPMMEQYYRIKEKYPDCVLFYRVGDFYEMFYDDAAIGSKVCDLVLTGKDCGGDERAPMCGVPYHSAEGYIGKLIAAGYKVGICEQVEDPKLTNKLVERDVIRIVTPGTLIEAGLLSENSNNYICSVALMSGVAGLSCADISTGELKVTSFAGDSLEEKLYNELCIYSPKELLLNTDRKQALSVTGGLVTRFGTYICDNRAELYDGAVCGKTVSAKFGDEAKFDGISDDEREAVIRSLGALLAYLSDVARADPASIKHLSYSREGQHLEMDITARKSLELCAGMHTGEKRGSLLAVIDKTKTPMGARLIKAWLERPLLSPNMINERLDGVEELYNNPIQRDNVANTLSKLSDIERLATRIAYKSANAKDLKALEFAISNLPELKGAISDVSCKLLRDINADIDSLSDICETIHKAICDEPPFLVREGGMIRDGYDSNVDYLRDVLKDGKGWIARLEATEKELTGIPKLKVGYNKVFGYYIEITNAYKDKVPERYIRKQTLTTCERFITEELKNMESTVLGAKEKLESLEYDLFMQIVEGLCAHVERIQKTASAVAKLDVLRSLAETAQSNSFCRPEVDIGNIIDIKEGRHPVVEAYLKDGMFVPNDTYLDSSKNKLALITGPNMAGKSTYMRQTALIIVLAQMGSFVPAKSARIGVVDKLFTRIGASDDLAFGKSTFMLEMSDVAHILKNATSHSFIIYDEIGRGTSTYDGMSIAKAVVEYTVSKKCGAKTLFATHYHELSDLENSLDGVVNYNIKAKKHGNDVIFLRKIVRGAADDSYGIEVAYLAGVPKELVSRARQILAELVKEKDFRPQIAEKDEQLSFTDQAEAEAASIIRNTDVDTLTPLEALNTLYKLKKILD